MNYIGISAGFHDAALSVIDDSGNILFAGHSERYDKLTDCPMLLNTSLNIRGEPMVNDRKDADRFELMYNVKVIS